MHKIISLTILLGETDATAVVDRTLALTSAPGQQAPIWRTGSLALIWLPQMRLPGAAHATRKSELVIPREWY
jgi:hypothetical protein